MTAFRAWSMLAGIAAGPLLAAIVQGFEVKYLVVGALGAFVGSGSMTAWLIRRDAQKREAAR